ncbi:MAG: hypothetical protein COV01_02020 [Candidatus Taylorbacteria bacterium CG10_big_fil_rev_8_21_14_0_10_41_48]|uniref:Uncharacterized protein n=1 Tax=Candidatus Taylorbacteria bacterium CG10_big_fil_rev_8_21_14_0_10_41_48 TaxID=1975024 RepID=A0A2M8LCG7_9BACT|nr:MAG: hypothetical protein COV01_02020 [Candidatus Taylorbacteria bacterium CG10_big_fil_rev_8_21_14_0_10_41_48]
MKFIPQIKKIADNLRQGDISNALEEKKSLGLIRDEVLKLEIEEVAKQATLKHLKNGEIDTAREIKNLFSMSDDMFENTVSQAVLSSFRDGDIERVKALSRELPISEQINNDLLVYCSTWGDTKLCQVMERALS